MEESNYSKYKIDCNSIIETNNNTELAKALEQASCLNTQLQKQILLLTRELMFVKSQLKENYGIRPNKTALETQSVEKILQKSHNSVLRCFEQILESDFNKNETKSTSMENKFESSYTNEERCGDSTFNSINISRCNNIANFPNFNIDGDNNIERSRRRSRTIDYKEPDCKKKMRRI